MFGADGDTVYFMNTLSGEAIECEGADTLVVAQGHRPVDALEAALAGAAPTVLLAGDCLSPRSAEEAVYEGLMAGRAV